MQVICISRGSQSRGAEFAERLAAKLGYECVSREQLLEEATNSRIPIGKLETAIIKPHIFSERLALESEHYKALATSILCQKALERDIVYHGRTGHLLLPGIDHILKIRVVSDFEYRLQHVVREMDISRAKAKRYIEQVDEDRRRWVKKFYNVDWDVFTLYDLVLNLSQMSADNAATAACAMADLPEFRATPASLSALRDLYLASRARLRLAVDPRTSRFSVKVRASNQVVYVTYLSQEISNPELILEALRNLEGAKEIVCTRAQTNILWIQEDFSQSETSYGQVLSLANTWDAAVELIKMIPGSESEEVAATPAQPTDSQETWRETGIIEEEGETESPELADVSKVYENLINDGRAGGKRVVQGTQNRLLTTIDRSVKYRLVIFDNVFVSKGTEARKRLRQEWTNSLSDALKTPVVTIQEIVAQYQFGVKQAMKMFLYAALITVTFLIVFNYAEEILTFLTQEGFTHRALAAACITAFVPLFAFTYGNVVHLLLKLIKLD
ncbi:MAG: cytidylate kinase-like family protein [bacterium]